MSPSGTHTFSTQAIPESEPMQSESSQHVIPSPNEHAAQGKHDSASDETLGQRAEKALSTSVKAVEILDSAPATRFTS